jgi:hypothetical protein
MGRSVYADQHSYEVLREFAHLKRKKINQLIKELVIPIEKRLLSEYGITISETGEATKKLVDAVGAAS